MIKVYIASPYSKGDIAVNVKRQIDTANELINLGFAPYAPLLCHFQHSVHPQSYGTWFTLDLEWITVCNCLLRLDGESPGADDEVMFAIRSIGIPVFYNIDELLTFKLYQSK